MTHCQQCAAPLVSEGLLQGQQVRCAKCAHVFRLGEEQKTSADRLAWRSFWLGLSSLILLFFTGLPAIYYGIRSMLRMRFIKSRPKDRFAAVAGTAMGGCFGVLGSGMVISFVAIIALTILTVNKPEDLEEKRQLYAQAFSNEMPADLFFDRAVCVLRSQYFFDFFDEEESENRSLRVHLVHHKSNFQPMQSQVVVQLRDRSLKIPGKKLVEQNSELLHWSMLNQDIEVRKIVFAMEPDEDARETDSDAELAATSEAELATTSEAEPSTGEVIQYYGICKSPLGFSGMTVIAKQPQVVFTEERIRVLFAELQPIK